MIRPAIDVAVYLCRDVVDMRKSNDWLVLLVQKAMELNPFKPAVFGLCNRQRNKVKILAWERSSLVLWNKRLEKERFKWSERSDGSPMALTGQKLNGKLPIF